MHFPGFTIKKLLTIFLPIFLLLPFFSFTSAQDNSELQTLTEVGSWPFGWHREVSIDEIRNLAFVNSGGAVLILDISTLPSPILVNDLIRTKGNVKDIFYNQTTQNLYVTLGENGLEIWDVQNINSPQLLSSLLLDDAGTVPPANKMVTKPGFIFIAAEYAGIITINVSDPANPYESSIAHGISGIKYSVSITENGNYLVATTLTRTELYAVNYDGSLSLLDFNTTLVGGWEAHISGLYSYEINQGVLYVLDLTSLGLPLVASHNLLGNPTDHYSITSSNNRLYVSDPFYGIEIFDITNPASLSLLGSYQTHCNDIKYFADHVFVPDIFGMSILDVTDPADPVLTSQYQGVGGINRDLKKSGSYCYLVTFYSLYVLDVSNPVLPELVGINQPSSGSDLSILIIGDYAYITNSEQGLRVVDISDPTNPITVGSVGSAYYSDMTSEGNYIYVTDNQDYLRVFDISNPTTPVEVGTLHFTHVPNNFTSGMAVKNGYVYVAQYATGLKVIDVTDPTHPILVATYNQNVNLTYLDIEGDYVYATDVYLSQHVDVFDVSDPLNPVIVGTKVFSNPYIHPGQDWAFGDILLVADHRDPYLAILDISYPPEPSIILTQIVPDEIWGVDLTDDYIYLAAYGAGLHIYENPYGIVPVELTSFTATANLNDVTLTWQTATETNNSGFEIQRIETSGVKRETKWERIGFVEGNGTTSEQHNYSFVDENIMSGSYEYRLKQIDLDGSFEFSEVVNVEISSPTEFSLSQNYPNPFNPITTIQYSIPEAGNVKLKVYNSLGEQAATLADDFKKVGNYQINFDASNFSSGIYFYQLVSDGFTKVRKMILIK